MTLIRMHYLASADRNVSSLLVGQIEHSEQRPSSSEGLCSHRWNVQLRFEAYTAALYSEEAI